MGEPRDYHFVLPEERPDFVPLNERLHEGFHFLSRNRASNRPGDPLAIVDTIVIHGTDGHSTESAVQTWRKAGGRASAHWIVPDEDEEGHGRFAWATVAETKAAWHCRTTGPARRLIGSGPKVNSRSLGVEVVNRITGGGDPYSTWQVDMTVEIVVYAWAKYPNLRHVVSHAKLDPTRRTDPGPLFPWDRFRQQVLDRPAAPAIGLVLGRARIHPELPAVDLDRAARWYRDKLGLAPVLHGNEPVPVGTTSFEHDLFYETGAARFGVYQSPAAGRNEATAARIVVDDFDAVHRRLLDNGVVFEDVDLGDERTVDGVLVSEDGEKTAWFKDSEGNILAIGSSV